MAISLPSGSTVLFQGDSITDADRLSDPDNSLGRGYARMAADLVRAARPDSGIIFINRGVAGDRVQDLRRRWRRDALALKPGLVSVMVGVNDTWRCYGSGDPAPRRAYEDDYRAMLTQIHDELGAQIILIEPFLIPVTDEQWSWREDLDPRIQTVRRLAEEFDAALLAADGLLNQAARNAGGAAHIVLDGVHPTPLGHELLARAWAELVTD